LAIDVCDVANKAIFDDGKALRVTIHAKRAGKHELVAFMGFHNLNEFK
jgi:hypothetical protein